MSEESGIYARESSYLDRFVQFGEAQTRIISLSFPHEAPDDASDDHDLIDRIDAYLEGVEDDFSDVTVALTVPTDHRTVLETVREIPYGEQIRVEKLIRLCGGMDPDDEDDVRAVRTALAENPVPLLVPDHRVRDGPSGAPAAVEQKLRAVEGL
jgi:methylated-DNA-[protein]-cysteine S-methyltransferase